ncbi:MAG: thioredoxin domain-containing protein [Gemmatimonadota bacterium]|nr:thioredoxin domain-containing protein [Gemmatimonadota bacterium]
MAPNRLVHEKSPYLLQHAHNPVDWYPWGDEAFAAARERDIPVFLSIGYATCHWCHVMEHESFEDADVARLMNDAFINIKVDREERPDIDGIYMTVAQLLTGQGGWPLTILMLPDRRPFFAATYLPKTSRYGRMGMLDLIPRIQEAWGSSREKLQDSAAAIRETLTQHVETVHAPASLDEATLRQGYVELAGLFDRERGGFGRSPKFPTPHLLLFLLRYWQRTGSEAPVAMVAQTLEAMRAGGIYDHVGFGFHRYATDGHWLVPHFEKMLYDQALLTLAYTEGWQATQAPLFERTVREILTYVQRDLTSPDGAFYSAEDADSEGEEGKFYVWSHDELREVIGDDDLETLLGTWGATAAGNWREEATQESTGTNILHWPTGVADRASAAGLAPADLEDRLETARGRLLARREQRVRPLLDDKVLTDWNGLMIAALARAGWVFRSDEWTGAARQAADLLWATMWREGALLHRYRDGEAAIVANLDDYAFLAWGEIELHQATQEPEHLVRALKLTDAMLERFWDGEHGGLFFSPAERDDLIVRMKEIGDDAIPSGSAVAMYNLLRLARLTGRQSYEERAGALADASSRQIATRPSAATFFLVALDFAIGPSQELVIVGEADDPATKALMEVAGESLYPRLVVLQRPPGNGGRLAELAPFVRDFAAVDGRPTAYLCQAFACEQPVTTPDELRTLLSRPGRID